MAVFNKFNDFSEQVVLGTHSLNSDEIKAMLTNTLPIATDSVYSDVSSGEVSDGNGYTIGGEDTQNAVSEVGGVASLTGVDIEWTATGPVGPFQYCILYNNTAISKNLVGWYDYGESISLGDTEKFTLDFGASILTLT